MKTNRLNTRILTMCMIAILMLPVEGMGRRKGYRLDVDKKEAQRQEKEESLTKGSFMVASQCRDCNNGYTIGQRTFAGYDKPQASGSETFFVTNGTDRLLTGINLYIDYYTMDGRQLHKRYVTLDCKIPAGETRMIELKSWDRQHAFYYEKSQPAKKAGTPYTITLDPISYYLRY